MIHTVNTLAPHFLLDYLRSILFGHNVVSHADKNIFEMMS